MWWLLLCSLPCICVGDELNIVKENNPTYYSYYVTQPDIEAPKWRVQTYDESALQPDHYWFVAPYLKLEQDTFPMWNGPYIYRTDGELIWSGGSFFAYHNIHDFRMSYFNGRMMLSLIQSKVEDAAAQLYDETYTEYKTFDITNGFDKANMHDFNLVHGGRRALALLHQHPALMPVPGTSNGTCKVKWEGFMEIDTSNNDIVYEWNAQGHLSLNESDVHYGSKKTLAYICDGQIRPWDAQHVNSIDKFPDGDYLLSARNTDAIYKISHKDHSIVWRLGGVQSDFVFGEGARFERQHHARVQSQNSTHILISVFNNARHLGFKTGEGITNHTAGLILSLRLDVTPMTADVAVRFDKPWWKYGLDDLTNKTSTRGSMQILPNGNAFMGWVKHCHVSEHAPDGKLLQQAALLKEGVDTYRSYKMAWVGRPAAPPDVVSQAYRKKQLDPLSTHVYVSWNGATEVVNWKVIRPGWLLGFGSKELATQVSAGFETLVTLDEYEDEVVVAGIDANGKELGRSGVIKTADSDGLYSPSRKIKLGPIIGTVVGGLCAVLLFLSVIFRKRLLELASKARRATYKPIAGGEDDGLLAAAAAEEDLQHELLDGKEVVEMVEYKDSRRSGESVGKPR